MSEKNPKICIIADNSLDREMFKRYLLQDTDYTYHFFEEESGKQGLELCKTVQPDCILVAYRLPDMDGLKFLATLTDTNGSLPFAVVMLARMDDEAFALEAMKKGAQDYLVLDEMTAGNLFRAIHQAIERTVMRRTLEQKNRTLQTFAYALAHDLRTPLRAITGFSQIIAQDYYDGLDTKIQHYIDHIMRAGQQMDQLIEDLLQYTRIENRPVQSKVVDLDYIFRQIVETMATHIEQVQANLTIAAGVPRVYGDPTLLTQIYANLIENALLYQRPNVRPEVALTWYIEQKSVITCVSDNGIGIATKQYEKIFHIFQRLHDNDSYPGTGIGLAIVKRATELMEGEVWIESIPGQGSSFFIRLPLAS